jgi:hypothetical protein
MILRALAPTSSSEFGAPMGLGCQRCELLDICGGTTDFDCYASCCGKHSTCTRACPHADGFVPVIQDAGGMAMKSHYAITQHVEKLPIYIPHIGNASCRTGRLSSSFVALTTFDISAPNAETRFASPQDLRHHYGLRDDAQILLLSVAKDNLLEHHWHYSEARRLAQYLATLGIAHITSPNFSFALNEPRPEHLVNRSRSLCEAERMAAAGMSVIPHLNAFNQKDWNCWRDFLRDHPHLSMVCQEFQTGLANGRRARWHIHQMCNVEQSLGRGLHLIATGGRRHLPLLIELSSVTIVDANPFVKTIKRRQLVDCKWHLYPTAVGAPLDQLLEANIAAYTRYVEGKMASLKELGPRPLKREVVPQDIVPIKAPIADTQMPLWPFLRATA